MNHKINAHVKVGQRLIILFFVIALCTCIDPYHPKLSGYDTFLVVEGLISDQPASYSIKLSRTTREQDAKPSLITDAIVYITDESGNRAELTSQGDGAYNTDINTFKGEMGKYYTLHISTDDIQYESDPCTMKPVRDIDSIYFNKEIKLLNNGSESQEGLMIYLDSKRAPDDNYYRWDFEETWKFKVPNPKKFNYINDSTILPVEKVNEFGWKGNKSDEVLIRSMVQGTDRIEKQPIHFIVANASDRLSLQYSILVKQYSISKNEYDFWNSMIKVNNSGADIFASQPFPVISNIHNINDPGELVLGYFQVSAVKQKRKYLSFSEIMAFDLPIYRYPCVRFEKDPKDYSMDWGASPTWDDVYYMFCVNKNYDFVEPLYIPGTTKLKKLVFSTPACADSEATGTSVKPDFWIDLN